jgi:hypothetical protein
MASLSLTLTVTPGQSDRLRDFAQQVVGQRRQEFEASGQRIGLTREGWYLQRTPMGELWTVWVEGTDPAAALGSFVQSQESFDVWFKQEVEQITGVDLNQPPADIPEVLFDWSASS